MQRNSPGAARDGGPVVSRPVRATPCLYHCVARFVSDSNRSFFCVTVYACCSCTEISVQAMQDFAAEGRSYLYTHSAFNIAINKACMCGRDKDVGLRHTVYACTLPICLLYRRRPLSHVTNMQPNGLPLVTLQCSSDYLQLVR